MSPNEPRLRPWQACLLSLSLLMSLPLISSCVSKHPAEDPRHHFGVLVMAHGGGSEWDDAVRAALQPVNQRYPTEIAFGMADAATIQQGVHALEARGVDHIAVIRLFVSGDSWKDRTAQILGIEPGAPPAPEADAAHHDSMSHHADHEMGFWRIDSHASFVMASDGLLDAPQMGTVLAERAAHLSEHPQTEDVLILAHGPGDDAENAQWLVMLEARARAVRDALPFRRVSVETLREDWPDKREAAEQRVRAFVQRAHDENGTALVIPFRVEGFGPYAKVLEGLPYRSDGKGLLPHPAVTEWIEAQADALRAPNSPLAGAHPQ